MELERLLYSREHAAELLDMSIRSLDYWIAAKEIETRRKGKSVKIPRGALVRFAQENHYESPKKLAAAAALT